MLACHFDSKDISGFVAATDSAVPCAMLLYIAEQLRSRPANSKTSIDVVFFDGEEAFREWSNSDSLYGSRHLAGKWSNVAPEVDGCDQRPTRLSQVRLFVLLDLIGAANPKFYNQYPAQTGREYNQLINIRKLESTNSRM